MGIVKVKIIMIIPYFIDLRHTSFPHCNVSVVGFYLTIGGVLDFVKYGSFYLLREL